MSGTLWIIEFEVRGGDWFDFDSRPFRTRERARKSLKFLKRHYAHYKLRIARYERKD